MNDINMIPVQELGVGSPVNIQILDTEEDLYYRLALDVFDEIKNNNEAGKNTVFIMPVGPIGHYKKLVWLINRYRLSLKNTTIFNMDEYLDNKKRYIPLSSPLSFRATMEREFYGKIDYELNVPVENRYFPEPGNEDFIWDKIQKLGGVDMCIGGVGINGHVAFNEPPEPGEEISNQEFMNLKTRVLKVSRETRAINAMGSTKGCMDLLPEWCITVGMKEILSAKKIRISMAREWNCGMVRKILHGPVTSKVPCSFLQMHGDALLYVNAVAAQIPIPGIQVYNK